MIVFRLAAAIGTVTLGTLTEFDDRTDSRVTDRQREVVLEALSRGYYDWPRELTSEQLADELDISRATLHEHLRKAERTLLSSMLRDQPTRAVADRND
jgi:predicted DNA binding protein